MIGQVEFAGSAEAELTQSVAGVVDAHLMRETGRERGRFYDVMYEFADLPDAGVDAGVFAVVVQQAGVSLLDEDHATGRRPHYVVVFGEERFHPLGQGLGVTLVARIGHRLATTGLIEGIIYLYAQLRE